MKRIAISSVLAAFTAGLMSGTAAADEVRSADRAAIQALMWRYVRALDTFNGEAYASAFTEDGSFGETKGRDALKRMVENLGGNRAADAPPMLHMIVNSDIEFIDENTARFHSYWMTVFGATGQGTTPRVAAAGRGVDELVRVDGEWLIKSRNVAPQD